MLTFLAILLASIVFIPLGSLMWFCLPPNSGTATLVIIIFIGMMAVGAGAGAR
jgi:hypothetical protein